MLPFHGRWRNASKRAPEREARLLMFAAGPDDDDDMDVEDEGADEGADDGAANARNRPNADAMRQQENAISDLHRRRMMRLLNKKGQAQEGLQAFEIMAEAAETQQEMEYMRQKIAATREMIAEVRAKDSDYLDDSVVVQLDGYASSIETIKDYVKNRKDALEKLKLAEWEHGEMPPSEFIANLRRYIEDAARLDEESMPRHAENLQELTRERADVAASNDLTVAEKEDKTRVLDKKIAYVTRHIAEKDQREHARGELLAEAVEEYEVIKRRKPQNLPFNLVQGQIATPEELWQYYTAEEKKEIISGMNRNTGLESFLMEAKEDIEDARAPLDNNKLDTSILKLQSHIKRAQSALDKQEGLGLSESIASGSSSTTVNMSLGDMAKYPFQKTKAVVRGMNNALGIEWTNVGEIMDGFKEFMESVQELKKRRRLGRVARNALKFGRIASWIPGMGGKDLVQTLEEQQEGKQNEVKDSYKKELGDSRNDFGFTDLFGSDGNGGRLKEFANAGDMNRTRAVLEYGASKGLLFDIEEKSSGDYKFPGGYTIADLVPREWNEAQIGTYFDNLKYMNNEGKGAAKKAGEQYVAGRSNADGYVEPFQGAINGLAIWFAQGIAEKAMSKVADGEMSTRLTLAIVDAWENNPLFRKHVPREWLDRICGTGKQMMIGMIKYEKDILLDGAQAGETDISKIRDKKGNESQLGKLVVAARQYMVKLDPSIAPNGDADKKKKFDLMLSQLLASHTVKLPNGRLASIYSEELAPLHIYYYPDQMRDVPVADLGDDFFIKRSEIIRGNLEVYRAVGAVNQSGFAHPVKARYFFSHIITAYLELKDYGKTASREQREEFKRAAEVLRSKARPNMDGWIEQALTSSGAGKILSEQHKDQDGRYLVLTLVELGLISLEKIEDMARDGNKYAVQLLQDVADSNSQYADPKMKGRARASAALFGRRGGKKRND